MYLALLKRLYSFIPGVCACLLPFLFNHSLFSGPLLLAILLAILLFLLLLYFPFLPQIFITENDCLVLLYLSAGLLNGLFHSGYFSPDLLLQWGVLGIVYLLCRIQHSRFTLIFLFLSGFLQAFAGILQICHLEENYSHLYNMTGSFNNPSQLGGLLAITGIIGLGKIFAAVRKRQNKNTFLFLCLLLPLLISLWLCDSRAAWLAFAGGTLYMLSRRFSKNKLKTGLFLLLILSCLLPILYIYKPHSADGRLLIWQVCWNMFKEAPLTGTGIHSFCSRYMLCQADYFRNFPDSAYIQIADNVRSPYNEFIHITVEQGLIGLTLWVILLIRFLTFSSHPLQQIYKSAFFAFIIFSCFSYPAETFPILWIVAILAGNLHSKVCFSFHLHPGLRYISVAATVLIICWSVGEFYFFRNTLKIIQQKTPATATYLKQYWNRLPRKPELLSYWLHINHSLSDKESLWGTSELARLLPDTETYCLAGETLMKQQRYQEARLYFMKAAEMVPGRVMPGYKLFKLYQAQGDKEKAAEMAHRIANQPIKVNNTFTLSVQGEIQRFLQASGKENRE